MGGVEDPYVFVEHTHRVEIDHVHVAVAHVAVRLLVHRQVQEVVHVLAVLVDDAHERVSRVAVSLGGRDATCSGCCGSSAWCACPRVDAPFRCPARSPPRSWVCARLSRWGRMRASLRRAFAAAAAAAATAGTDP